MVNLCEILDAAAAHHPQGIAVVDGDTSVTYHKLFSMVNHLAAALQKVGICQGNRVVIILPNSLTSAVLFWALVKCQAIVVPLSESQAFDDTEHCIRDVTPNAVIFGPTRAGDVKRIVEDLPVMLIGVDVSNVSLNYEELLIMPAKYMPPSNTIASDIAVIMYTSGTSGTPKGVLRTHANGIAAAAAHVMTNGYRPYERILATMPLSHTMGLHLLLATAMLAGTLVLYRDVMDESLGEVIIRQRVSALYMIPTLYHALVSEVSQSRSKEITTVKKLGYAGATMSDHVIRDCYTMFKPSIFLNHYGSTEVYTHTVCPVRLGRLGCVGNTAETDQIRLVHVRDSQLAVTVAGEVGEILVPATAPDAFHGYWRRPDMTRLVLRDGWYHTGDLGYFDTQGDLFVVGRADDMIISGDQHIYPTIVENHLQHHPKVRDVAVTGEADGRWGQIVVAYVVADRDGVTPFELDGYFKREGSLPVSVRPRKYVFVRNIPRSTTGKILHRTLANLDSVIS